MEGHSLSLLCCCDKHLFKRLRVALPSSTPGHNRRPIYDSYADLVSEKHLEVETFGEVPQYNHVRRPLAPWTLWPTGVIATPRAMAHFSNRHRRFGNNAPSRIMAQTLLKVFPDVMERNLSQQRELFGEFLFRKITNLPVNCLAILIESASNQNLLCARLCTIIEEMTELLPQQGRNSIDKFLDSLHTKPGFIKAQSLQHRNFQRQILFMMLGWLSCLYQPHSLEEMAMEIGDSSSLERMLLSCNHGSQLCDRATRPILELLCGFEDYLPIPHYANGEPSHLPQSAETNPGKAIHVSNLNASTLTRVGKVIVVWTSSLAAHLQFKPVERELYLFALPSFCQVCEGNDQSAPSLLLKEYYQIMEQHVSSDRLYKEVELSYELIFGQDDRARKLYREHERKKARQLLSSLHDSRPLTDARLDRLCGFHTRPAWRIAFFPLLFNHSDVPTRSTYSSQYDFSIFSPRLLHLQNYMESIQVNDVSALWRDRRDLLRWYTFWAVAIIGGIGIILALVQDILAASQLAYSIATYNLQVAQGSKGYQAKAEEG